MVNVPVPWPLTATWTSLPTDTVRVPWTTGAGDEAGAEDGADDDEDEDEAGAVEDEEDPDGEEPPGAAVAEREVAGAAREPGPVANTAGAVPPPGPADGAAPAPPVPGVRPPEPWDGARREFPTTPGPALPRAPASGGWDGGAPPPRISTTLTPAAAAAVAAVAARARGCRRTRCQPDTPGGRLGLGKPDGPNWPAPAATLAR